MGLCASQDNDLPPQAPQDPADPQVAKLGDAFHNHTMSPTDRQALLDEMWEAADKDKNGVLDKDEVKNVAVNFLRGEKASCQKRWKVHEKYGMNGTAAKPGEPIDESDREAFDMCMMSFDSMIETIVKDEKDEQGKSYTESRMGLMDANADGSISREEFDKFAMQRLDWQPLARTLSQKKAAEKAAEKPADGARKEVEAAVCTLDDNTCTLAPYFKLKDAAKFKELWKADYAKFAHKDDCVHYAFTFTEDDSRAHCREAYPDADKLLQHIQDVGATFHDKDGGCLHPDVAELENLEIHGPAAELEKLKEPLKALPVKYYTCEWGFRPAKEAMEEDTVVHLYPFFTLKDTAEFKKIWGDAYAATKAAAAEEKSHQYAFSFDASNNMASCRESYGDADGVLCHLGNVKAPLDAVLAGPAGLDHLEVHGPAAEIEKLKPALGPLGAQFFVTGWGFRNATK